MRGTGTTTQQIQSAPRNSLFIWCTDDVNYIRDKCDKLERKDITVAPVSTLDDPAHYCGARFSAVVVDHFVEDKPSYHEGFIRLLGYCVRDFDVSYVQVNSTMGSGALIELVQSHRIMCGFAE